jgi:2-dehydro-3-deoxyglucarate aldolase/4-hydroxy-2-oxoheptanedioate aldolase
MNLKEKLKLNKPLIGAHVNLRDPIATEILGALGYDYLFIDTEHASLSEQDIYHHLLAARAAGTSVIVRVPVDDLTMTKHILEMGPDGILFPMVKDAEHAKALLADTLYPPYGTRGCGPKGAVRYGLDNEPHFYKEGHLSLCRFVMIEKKSAALDAERIASIPYLDGCVLGMHDLSGSISRLGDVFCEENLSLAKMAADAFLAEKKAVGLSTYAIDEKTLATYRDLGVNMISTGADYDYILRMGRDTLQRASEIFKGTNAE